MLNNEDEVAISASRQVDQHHGPAIDFRALAWLALAGAGALIFARWDVLYGYSVDLGLHFALVNALFEQMSGGQLKETELGVMIHYPRGAHWFAAALSTLTNSPLLSINLITLIALYAGYLAIGLLLLDGDAAVTLFRLSLALVATWCLSGQQAALGYQVILNFFFPQLVGEAAVLLALYLVSRATFWSLPPLDRAALLVAATWLFSYIQPLAAAQFGGTVVLYSLLASTIAGRTIRVKWRLLAGPGALAAFVIAATLLHPAFRTMSAIEAHDGYLRFGEWLRPDRHILLAAIALAVAGLLVTLVVRGRLGRSPTLMLAAAAATGATLLVMQKLLLGYGIGSQYAVSKHVFFVATVTMIGVAFAVPTLLLNRNPAARALSPTLAAVVPVVFALTAFGLVFSRAAGWRQELRPVLEYQAFASHYYRFHRPGSTE